ncbi:helix-turn-helix domain-containing protein [Bacillus cereus]
MSINTTYTFHIYLNKVQKIVIAKTIGCSRCVYNHFLVLDGIPRFKSKYNHTQQSK